MKFYCINMKKIADLRAGRKKIARWSAGWRRRSQAAGMEQIENPKSEIRNQK